MRLIDADELQIRYEYGFDDNGVLLVPYRDVKRCIESAPTVDIVKHGTWIIHHSGGCVCSACKRWLPFSHKPKYCENCGTKMDLEEQNES